MIKSNQTLGFGYVLTTPEQRNRVLRNTYWLLAASMLPTVVGAWIGVESGLSSVLSGWVGLIAMLVGGFGFIYAIERTKNSGSGVFVLLGFTFFMGLMLSSLIANVLGFKNGASLVMTAFGGTAVVFFVMASLATVIKKDLSGMGKWLMVGVLLLIVASLANIWLQLPALMLTVMVLAIAIFSAFILVDVQRVVHGGETNYIMATLAIYLDVYNVFTNLLALLGIFGGNKE